MRTTETVSPAIEPTLVKQRPQGEEISLRTPRVLSTIAQLGVAESYDMRHLRDQVRACADWESARWLIDEYEFYAREMLTLLEGRDISGQMSNFCLSALRAVAVAEALHLPEARDEYELQVMETQNAATLISSPIAGEILDLF